MHEDGVEAAEGVVRQLEHRGAVLIGRRGRHMTHLVQLQLLCKRHVF